MEQATIKTDTDWSLNMDFEQVACVLSHQQQWISSPADGVSRIPLAGWQLDSQPSYEYALPEG